MTAAGRLRDFDRWQASVRNYDWLGKSASGATDLDCLIERRGHFLVVEGKTWHGGLQVPLGQHIALMRLATLPPFTVLLVGETEGGETFHYMRLGKPAPLNLTKRGAYYPQSLFTEATREDLRTFVQQWLAEC